MSDHDKRLVPLTCFRQLKDWAANFHGDDAHNLAVENFEVEPLPGTKVELCGVQCLNGPHEVVLVEMRIGEDFPLQDNPIDVSALRGDPYFEIPLGTVAENLPLVLSVQACRNPSERPFLNIVFWGYETVLDEQTKKKAEAEVYRRKGYVHVHDLNKWLDPLLLQEDAWAKSILTAIQDFRENKDPYPRNDALSPPEVNTRLSRETEKELSNAIDKNDIDSVIEGLAKLSEQAPEKVKRYAKQFRLRWKQHIQSLSNPQCPTPIRKYPPIRKYDP